MSKETERKFLIDLISNSITSTVRVYVPKVEKRQEIEQVYLSITDHEEVRIRKLQEPDTSEGSSYTDTITTYTVTVKTGKGMTRKETETSINSSTYEELLKLSNAAPLRKSRLKFKYRGYSCDLDMYSDPFEPTIEIEFPREEEAKAFNPPSWMGLEVTDVLMYKNQSLFLAVQGRRVINGKLTSSS